MALYDCVLPVDFERLRDIVLPAWIEFIAGERVPRAFADEFAPWQVGVADREEWGEDHWLETFDLPAAYVEWFRARLLIEWDVSTMSRDVGHLLTWNSRYPAPNSLPWCANELLALVIKQSCAVELPGEFKDSNSDLRYYNRLHDPPFVQVAGTKNRFWFLEELYEWDWEQGAPFYTLKRNGNAQERTYMLVERLFFNVRIFPGTWPMQESVVWKASDELQISGFLSGQETQELASYLPQLDALLDGLEGKMWKFDLFADCVQRAAHCRAGLVTIFGGL